MTPLVEAIRNWKRPLTERNGLKVAKTVWNLDPGFIGIPVNSATIKAIGNFVDDRLIQYSSQRGVNGIPNSFWALIDPDDHVAAEAEEQGDTRFIDVPEPGRTTMISTEKILEDTAPEQQQPGQSLHWVPITNDWNVSDWTPGHDTLCNTHGVTQQSRNRVRDYFVRQPPPEQDTEQRTQFRNDHQTVIRIMKPKGSDESFSYEQPNAYVTNYEIDYRRCTVEARIIIAPQGADVSQEDWFDLCTGNDEPDNLKDMVKKTIWENMNFGIGGRFSLGKISPSEAIALESLRNMISEKEFRRYLKYGFLIVMGSSGLRYQIFRDKWHTKVWNGGQVVEEICVRIRGENIPPTDNVIAFKCMLEAGEQELRQIGNVYNMKAA